MDIVKQLDEAIVKCMKENNKVDLSTFRMAKNALQTEKINKNHELNDEEIITTLKKFVKSKKDDIEEYKKYQKDDVVASLQREVDLINKYLPEELSIEEINKGLDKIFESVQPTSIKDMGRLMNEANNLFGVKADKSLVSKLIKERLS